MARTRCYSAATLVEKHETINGIPVDRLSVTLNLDSPLFKMPGQKEQLQMFYPDGKMEVNYAIKGDRLLSASADRMKELLSPGEAKAGAKSTLKPEKGTCLAGYVNVLGFVGRVLAGNPAVPQGAKDKLAKLDGQGAGIEFQVSMDDQMHAVARVPLKLFRELGRLKDD